MAKVMVMAMAMAMLVMEFGMASGTFAWVLTDKTSTMRASSIRRNGKLAMVFSNARIETAKIMTSHLWAQNEATSVEK